MQTTSNESRNLNKRLHDVSEGTQSVDQMASEAGKKAKMMARDTAEMAGQYYDQASSWIGQNYGKTLGLIGLIAASGVVGFMLGRNREMDSSETTSAYHS